jgi:hypothetical protein
MEVYCQHFGPINLGASAVSTASVPLSRDLIVRGGSALTMDDADRVLFDVALAIADGRILAVCAEN